jgi:prepilin-type N-terminal cleavage/methylation domain-containing protein
MSGRTRGLTLIEVLIVIGLLLALAALALPAMVHQLDARAFEAGGDTVQRHLVLARAHARRTRDPVEVVYEVADRRMVARPFDVKMLDGDAPEPAPLATVWSVRELPGRVVLSEQAPPGALSDDEVAVEEAASAPFIRVAVFLGDGSTLVGNPFWLTDDDGRWVRMTLNPLTGTAVQDSGEGDEEPEEEEDEEEGEGEREGEGEDDSVGPAFEKEDNEP